MFGASLSTMVRSAFPVGSAFNIKAVASDDVHYGQNVVCGHVSDEQRQTSFDTNHV